ncbi:hypothetical protein [Nocardioides sp.]|uniref:hypothetical protein n=1 Tax=Nocardioides sp. TaxID=35761 RepID=UPI0035287C5A
MQLNARAADASTVRLLDSLNLVWVAFWLLIGVWTCVTLWQVADVGDTLAVSGTALHSSGEALTKLGSLPVVGDDAAAVGADVTATGQEVTVRGQEVKGELRQLAVLLGISIIAVPMAPVFGLYLPLRLARRRDVRTIRAALLRHADEDGLNRYLGARAVAHLSYGEIRAITGDPWRLLAADPRALADAELERLGLTRPRP